MIGVKDGVSSSLFQTVFFFRFDGIMIDSEVMK